MPSFPRVPRLDADTAVAQLRAATGIGLAVEGRCPGGQAGAAYVRWPDGRRSVLTTGPPGRAAAARRTAALLAVGREHRVPAPRYELVQDLPGGTVVVQELLPGSPPTAPGRATVESMIEMNRRCRGILAARDDPAPSLYLTEDGPGFCLHQPLAAYDRRTARLLAEIEEVGGAVPERLPGTDLVHFDFHPENVLTDRAGTVTGVVDWDGAGRSHGYFDLFTLRFDLARRAPDLGRWLAAHLAGTAPDEVVLACWAHMSLRLVDWSLREIGPEAAAIWLDVAEELRPE
jgi:Phosphotransferase enzyme family